MESTVFLVLFTIASTILFVPFLVFFVSLECLNSHFGRVLLWQWVGVAIPHLIQVVPVVAADTYGMCIFNYATKYQLQGDNTAEDNVGDQKLPKMIALTIDDCPGDSVEHMLALLQVLKESHAQATFFCTTNYISQNPKMNRVMKLLLADGHELGNHMPEDRPYDCDSGEAFEKLLQVSEGVLFNLDSVPVHKRFFRPPGGKLSNAMVKVLEAKGYRGIAMGDVYSNDAFVGASLLPIDHQCVEYHVEFIRKYSQPGSVVVCHVPNYDRRRQVLPVLHQVLSRWKAENTFTTVSLGHMEDLIIEEKMKPSRRT